MGKQLCPDCSGNVIFDDNEFYCKDCGLVVEDAPVNLGHESVGTNADGDFKQRRTGPPSNYLNPFGGTFFDLKKK